jgi:hypothetical protein
MMTAFILYTAFCGSLVSILSLPVRTITSFQNILDYDFKIYGEQLTISVERMLKVYSRSLKSRNLEKLSNLECPYFQNLGKFDEEVLLNPHEGVEVISNSKSAYISPLYAFYLPLFQSNYNGTMMCNTVSGLPMGGFPTRSGMFVRKGSPLKGPFNVK